LLAGHHDTLAFLVPAMVGALGVVWMLSLVARGTIR